MYVVLSALLEIKHFASFCLLVLQTSSVSWLSAHYAVVIRQLKWLSGQRSASFNVVAAVCVTMIGQSKCPCQYFIVCR